jgi:hypothetical protein
VAPPAGRPDVGTRLPFLFRATPVAEPDGRSLRSKANNCRGRAFRRHARRDPRRYEPVAPCVPSSIRAIGTRLAPPSRRSVTSSRRVPAAGYGAPVLYTGRRLTPVQIAPITCAWMRDGPPYLSPEMVVVPAQQIVGGVVTAPILARCRPIVRASVLVGGVCPRWADVLDVPSPLFFVRDGSAVSQHGPFGQPGGRKERPRAASAWRRIVRARGPKPCRVRRSFSV